MTHILHTSTVHKTALLADEGNSGHLNTHAQARDRTRNFCSQEHALTARPKLMEWVHIGYFTSIFLFAFFFSGHVSR